MIVDFCDIFHGYEGCCFLEGFLLVGCGGLELGVLVKEERLGGGGVDGGFF